MKLAGYLRVSSLGQIDAWGLDRQESAIKSWTKQNNHKIVSWFRDEGVSGTVNHGDRPGLSAAIDCIGRSADGLVIADLDRLARELQVQEAALAVVWKAGGRVFTATGGEVQQNDPNDAARNFIRKVMGLVIEFEKDQAVKRMRQGREAKAAQGKHSVGQYNYGFKGAGKGRDRDAAPDPEEQQAVDMVLALRDSGSSYRAIAAALDTAGFRPRRSQRWSAMAVRNIVIRADAE